MKRVVTWAICIVLMLAYICLAMCAATNWQEPPKGPSAWLEWERAYGRQGF